MQVIVDQLGQSQIRCLATFKDVVAQACEVRADIGDLFVTSGGLVFLPYYPWPSTPNWTAGGATVLAGIGAGLGLLVVQHSERIDAQSAAGSIRAAFFGAPIEDRIRYCTNNVPPVVIPKDGIKGVEVNADNLLLRIAHTTGQFVIAVGNAAEAAVVIKELIAGNPVERADPEGANLRWLAPTLVIHSIVTGDIQQLHNSDLLETMFQNADYLERFVGTFKRRDKATRVAVRRAFATLQGKFATALREKLNYPGEDDYPGEVNLRNPVHILYLIIIALIIIGTIIWIVIALK